MRDRDRKIQLFLQIQEGTFVRTRTDLFRKVNKKCFVPNLFAVEATFVRTRTDPLAKPVRGKGNINQLLLTTTKDSKKKTINYQ